jgi:cyclopropane-fatty-acyl-phospholipid synthase
VLVHAVFRRIIHRGNLTVAAAGGQTCTYGDGTGTPVRIRFATSGWQTAVVLDPELRLGEAYMNGGLVVEQGTIAEFLTLVIQNVSRKRPTPWSDWVRHLRTFLHRVIYPNTLSYSQRNAKHHYNINQQLYRLFLDQDMQYSCAYFENQHMTIDDAQIAKKRHIASKLLLDRPGLKVLDIGSGWGGLGIYLDRTAQASVLGINLSDEQVRVARQRAAAQSARCEFRLEDYRTTTGKFDRIVSVGMFEHVGKPYYKRFFDKCYDLLDDDGIMLLHTVARSTGPADTNAWVWRYIFPGGYTPALSELAPIIERSGFILSDVEILRLHYAETLRHWRERFLAQRDQGLRLFDERFLRMWEFYLAGFEASFRYYGLVVFQLQLSKKIGRIPLTREYMYNWQTSPPQLRA